MEEKEDEEEEALVGEVKASPHADTTILFVKGEGLKELTSKECSGLKLKLCVPSDFPANNIVKFLLGFTNKGSENFVVESLDASFRYPQVQNLVLLLLEEIFDLSPSSCQDYQFYIQNFTALQLGTVVPPARQATFEYSFIPAEPMGGRPFGLVINLNYKDSAVSARVAAKPRHETPIWEGDRCFVLFSSRFSDLFSLSRGTCSRTQSSTRL